MTFGGRYHDGEHYADLVSPRWGPDPIALDASNILDWQPSTGNYSLVRFRPTDVIPSLIAPRSWAKKTDFGEAIDSWPSVGSCPRMGSTVT